MVLEDVGKFFGIACRVVGKEGRAHCQAGNWHAQGRPKRRPRRNTPHTDLEYSSSTYNLFNPLTLCLYYTLAHGDDDYRLGSGVGGLLSEVGDSETQRRN